MEEYDFTPNQGTMQVSGKKRDSTLLLQGKSRGLSNRLSLTVLFAFLIDSLYSRVPLF